MLNSVGEMVEPAPGLRHGGGGSLAIILKARIDTTENHGIFEKGSDKL